MQLGSTTDVRHHFWWVSICTFNTFSLDDITWHPSMPDNSDALAYIINIKKASLMRFSTRRYVCYAVRSTLWEIKGGSTDTTLPCSIFEMNLHNDTIHQYICRQWSYYWHISIRIFQSIMQQIYVKFFWAICIIRWSARLLIYLPCKI